MKYNGKYKKCRTCKHIIDVWTASSSVKPSCPNYEKGVGMAMKTVCEECEYWESNTGGVVE